MANNIHNDYQPEAFQGIDLEKLRNISKKSILWVILIFLFTNVVAYLVIRWTKPLYESESEIKLDLKSNASELGIGFVENQNLNLISSEIELIKSRLFFNQVIDALDLKISYYTIGQILVDEKYKSSPFNVEAYLKSDAAYDRRYYVELINNSKFIFSLHENFKDAKEYRFGEIIETPLADFKIRLNRDFDPSAEFQHFFTINSDEALLTFIEKNLSVEPINVNANTIRISFKDHNRQKAYDLVNTIDTLYLQYSQQDKLRENDQKIDYLNHQLAQIENLLENYETYFEEFTLKYRTSDLDKDLEEVLKQINQLDSQQYILERNFRNMVQLESDLESGDLNALVVSPSVYPSLQQVVKEYNEQVEELNKIKQFYKETTATYSLKVKQVREAKTLLQEQIEQTREKVSENLSEIDRRKNILEQNFAQIPEKTTEYNKKQRFFKLYEEFYLSLMQTKAEFEIAQAGTTPDFKILSPASMPAVPISPNKPLVLGIGFVAGIFLSLLLIVLRYLLSNRILSINELEHLTHSAILGSLPTLGFGKLARLVIDAESRSAISESFRTIRTNIEFMLTGKHNKLISVTSTVGGEGKTFVSVNLGGIIALSKRKVVVVDLDMRKPKIHEAFQEENSAKGVSTALINKHSIDECVRHTSIHNLDYIPAGPTPPNPSELLLNGEFDSLLEKLKKRYDIVIIDTPPVGIVTDGILVMHKVDLPIYVFRANFSRKTFLKTFNRIQKVNNVQNLAVILNAVPTTLSKYYGSGYYEEKKKRGTFSRIKMILGNT